MNKENHPLDDHYMRQAEDVSKESKDHHTQVGCVIVGQGVGVRGWGCNDFPRGVHRYPERCERPEKYFYTAHAERSAIDRCAHDGKSTLGCTIYVTMFPCADCARGIIQSGIVELVTVRPNLTLPKWGEEAKRALTMFEEADITIRYLEKKNDFWFRS